MLKLKATLVIFTLLMAQSLMGLAQYDEDAKAVLDAMSNKYKENPSFEANFSYVLESPSEEINDKFEGKILVKDNKYYLDLGNQAIFNNEQYLWTYIKEVNEVTITEYYPDPENLSPTDVYSMYEDGFKYRIVEDETIDDNKYKVIELNPEDRSLSFHKILLFIDANDYTLKKWQTFEKSGRKYTYQINNFAAKKNISDQAFVFAKEDYPGVDVVDLR